jgi:biopolymer transport protein TolQ
VIAVIQAAGAMPDSFRILLGGSTSTRIVLILLTLFSLASWVMILWKWKQFRTLRRDGGASCRRSSGAAARGRVPTAMRLPETPYTRIFRQGANFFSELRPGALRENAAPQPGLTETQLHALWLVLEKVQDEERDSVSGGLVWLAIIAVSHRCSGCWARCSAS